MRVASNAKPQCQFYKETTVVREDSRRSVRIDQVSKGLYQVALTIEQATSSDKGRYKLVAKNEKGEVTSETIEVDLEGKINGST